MTTMTAATPLTIVLEGEQPMSLNAFYSGMHWKKRKSLADTQHQLIRAKIDPNEPPFGVPVHITFTIYYATRRLRDIDNATVKMYIDGLKPFVIEDDSYHHVKAITKVYEYDKERPRVEIDVRPWNGVC